MEKLQISPDDEKSEEFEAIAKELKVLKSTLSCDIIQNYLKNFCVKKLEKCHRIGYENFPIEAGEFDVWENEQIWC